MASKNILPTKIKAVLTTISSPAPAIATLLTIPKEFQKFTKIMDDGSIFVLTGDIADMWIRDSAAQVWPYRDTHPTMVTRVLQRQSMFILADPYANSYKDVFRAKVSAGEKRLGRGGWVATRNYEVDSGCYFLRLLHHMWKHHHVDVGPYRETASALLDTWTVEQHHEEKSPYRYPELARNGLGAKTAYTGMTWGAFRPSDDACKYGYHIPSNFFVAEVMDYVAAMWGGDIKARALVLQQDVLSGIVAHGVKDGKYCYEVDGLGHCNMMDDANVPSLLSIPYINSRHYDRATWQNTYAWIWSVSNPYFFVGKVASGIGSPHTPRNHIWPMSIIVRGLVDPAAKSEAVQTIERTRTPAIHESFHKDNPKKFTRPWFGWVNALYQELKGAGAPFEPSSGGVGTRVLRSDFCNVTRFEREPKYEGGNKFAYVWYVSEINYAWSALVGGEQLRTLGASVPFVWVVTANLPKSVVDRAHGLGVLMKNSLAIKKGTDYYRFSLNKLKVFSLVEYDRIVFMDADSLPMQNMDSWFHFPLADIVAPCSYWEDRPSKFTSFVMVVRPSMVVYDKLLKYTKSFVKPDMDVLNAVVDDVILLPSSYGILNSEWERGDRVYHMHNNTKPYIVHFTAKGKPWQHPPAYFSGANWDEEFRSLHTRWWKLRKKKLRSYKWSSETASGIYQLLYTIIREFEESDTSVFLYAGSVLGVRRHHGLIPWDKDVDLALFSTDTMFINRILDKLKLKWKYNTDGNGPGNTGFGYHIDTKFNIYIDIWLYKQEDHVVKCVGVDNGCIRWHNKYNKEIIEYNASVFFPPVYAPFGPYMLPIPHDSTTHLNLKYTANWREKCGGWTRGKTPCSSFARSYPFVRIGKNNTEELWSGNTLIHKFRMVGDTYVPINEPK